MDGDDDALRAVVHWYDQMRSVHWDRAIIAVCAGFHLVAGAALVVLPDQQVITPSTAPVFTQVDLIMQTVGLPLTSRAVWAGLFLAAALNAFLLVLRVSTARQRLTWFLVIPIGFDWAASFVLNVLRGGGDAMLASAYVVLLTVWSVAAFRTALVTR